MRQFGLRQTEGPWAGLWLPRDAGKRASPDCRFETPDLWQDEARAKQLADQYWCQLVEFDVQPVVRVPVYDDPPAPDTYRDLHTVEENPEDVCGAV